MAAPIAPSSSTQRRASWAARWASWRGTQAQNLNRRGSPREKSYAQLLYTRHRAAMWAGSTSSMALRPSISVGIRTATSPPSTSMPSRYTSGRQSVRALSKSGSSRRRRALCFWTSCADSLTELSPTLPPSSKRLPPSLSRPSGGPATLVIERYGSSRFFSNRSSGSSRCSSVSITLNPRFGISISTLGVIDHSAWIVDSRADAQLRQRGVHELCVDPLADLNSGHFLEVVGRIQVVGRLLERVQVQLPID